MATLRSDDTEFADDDGGMCSPGSTTACDLVRVADLVSTVMRHGAVVSVSILLSERDISVI